MSTLVDRFLCRREGHKPAVSVKSMTGFSVDTYMTTCVRCGKWVEVTIPKDAA